MWVAPDDLPRSAGHPFYERLNRVLSAAGFDAFVEDLCAKFYAATQLVRQELAAARAVDLQAVQQLLDPVLDVGGTRGRYNAFLTRLAQASGIETPTAEELARFDRKRKKKMSNEEWTHPHDPDSKIAKMKDEARWSMLSTWERGRWLV